MPGRGGHRIGGLAQRGGEQVLPVATPASSVLLQAAVAPADDGQHAGHHGGQGLHGRAPPADLGQQHGRPRGRRGRPAGPRRAGRPGRAPSRDRARSVPRAARPATACCASRSGEVHHRGRPSTRSATRDSRIWVVPPAMVRHRVSRNSWLAAALRPAPSGPQQLQRGLGDRLAVGHAQQLADRRGWRARRSAQQRRADAVPPASVHSPRPVRRQVEPADGPGEQPSTSSPA